MTVRRKPGKVKVTGHGKVTVQGLKQTSRALRKANALLGGTGGGEAAGELGKRLLEAGELVAAIARGKATWSQQIPPAIKVRGGRTGVNLVCGVGPAYPNEIPGVRHPTFGHDPWMTNQNRPFFAPAADEGADPAAALVALVIDEWAAEYGFE